MKLKFLFTFLLLNFAALAIGSFVANPAEDVIYQNLNRAPWTPPGWVFGAAWTIIMIAFAFFMEYLFRDSKHNKSVMYLYGIQWLLNVSWNPIFFGAHLYGLGLVALILLLAVLLILVFRYKSQLNWRVVFIAPYILWMAVAISLNTFVVLYN